MTAGNWTFDLGKLLAVLFLCSVTVPAVQGQLILAINFEGKIIPFSTPQNIGVSGGTPPYIYSLYQSVSGQNQFLDIIATGAYAGVTFTPSALSPQPTAATTGFFIGVQDSNGNFASTNVFGIASAPAGGTGDPLFVNWSGEAYEFVGADNATFNLLSTWDHNLNVHLVGANLSSKADGGTLMDAFGLKLNNNTVEVSIDEAGEVTVVLDGDLVITRETLNNTVDHKVEADLGEDAMVIVELYREYHGHSVQIFTPTIHLVIYPTLPGMDSYYTESLRAHLNFDLHLRDPSISGIHGIIGQSAPNSYVSTKRRKLLASAVGAAGTSTARFTGQGTESWYKTTSLFAHDNKLNQFGKEQLVHPAADHEEKLAEVVEVDGQPSSRRRLLSFGDDDDAPIVVMASGRQHL